MGNITNNLNSNSGYFIFCLLDLLTRRAEPHGLARGYLVRPAWVIAWQ